MRHSSQPSSFSTQPSHPRSRHWILFGQEGEQKAFEEMSQFANEHSLKLVAKKVQK